jgi:phosphoketolase
LPAQHRTTSTSSSPTSRSICSSRPSTKRSIHCAKGLGIWARASTDAGEEPDVVLACCGDVATMEALAAAAILRERQPDLKLRFVNVVDLFKLQPASEHPHGSTEREFDSLFTSDKPIIFNFHGYPWLIHRLAYRFRGHDNLHVRGYKEKGNINTPLELAMLNETSRFHLVIDVIDRVPKLRTKGAHLKEEMKNAIIDNLATRTSTAPTGRSLPTGRGRTDKVATHKWRQVSNDAIARQRLAVARSFFGNPPRRVGVSLISASLSPELR